MSLRTVFVVLVLGAGSVIWLAPRERSNRLISLEAQSGATIAGSLVDDALTPLAGVEVILERDSRVEARVTSDSGGLFRFTGVAPGPYRVRAASRGFVALSKDIVVPRDATAMQLPLVMSRVNQRVEERAATRPAVPGEPQAGPAPPATSGLQQDAAAPTSSVVITAELGRLTAPFASDAHWPGYRPEQNETYSQFAPNRFQSASLQPLSTFGADVDTASYSNVRRFLSSGRLPPREAVRLEEMVNYFRFAYAAPQDGRPIALTTEVADCPWAPSHKLVLIGARAAAPARREVTRRNITLLIDVSGSMAPPERLPLIRSALAMFADTLRADDTLAMVTYAGSSGIALRPTQGRRRDVIQQAIANLGAGGSTNGAQGLITAYRVAREAFVPGGVNRVILATDGDFNVGITSESELLRLIERERESGVFLSVLGVGSGNLKDRTMEMLADKGNGNYSYLDSLQEARRVLIREGDATLETVAKDVKFQVEFNPAAIGSWKLLGYENRALNAEDFNDDRKDAGEMGAGHTVTVLYEVIPAGAGGGDDVASAPLAVDPLRYQAATAQPETGSPASTHAGEWLQVKARYKQPEGEKSAVITQVVRPGSRTQHLPLASAVAEFALLLRDAPRDAQRWDALSRRVQALEIPAEMRSDRDGFTELVEIAKALSRR